MIIVSSEEKILLNHIKDLASASYNQNRYIFSEFLSLEEQALIDTIRSEVKHVNYEFFGGQECCERQTIRFGKGCRAFQRKKVLLDGRICENNSYTLKAGSSFSIRGVGKFIYEREYYEKKLDYND